MIEPNLKASIDRAHDCGIKLHEMTSQMASLTDEEKLVFWTIFFCDSLQTVVNQVGTITANIILNSLVAAI